SLAICAAGGCGASTGAASATATTIPTSAAPIRATGVSVRRHRARAARAGSRPRGSAATAGAAPASLIANAGVEVRVEEVHEKVDENEGDGEDHHGALHDR